MKKELLMILCMTLVCASVMLGIMGVYKITGNQRNAGISEAKSTNISAFKIQSLKSTA